MGVKTMSKKYGLAPVVRMSKEERLIVQYITSRLEAAYRNTSGKPVYAKNMDQVMKDIFGMKKFTKTLEKARYNEALMISLMKRLDTETLWQITRSSEHYKMLCTLVALDKNIVTEQKRYDKMANMEPAERPTRKMRKIAKEVKRCRKMYKQVVKTFRNIFDIHKVDTSSNSIMDTLEDWLDRHDTDDDIFFDMGYDDIDMNAIESMDAYVRKASGKKRKNVGRRPVREGALDIFGSRFDDDEDDIFDDDDDEMEESAEDRILRKLMNRLGGGDDYDDESEDDDEPDNGSIGRILSVIQTGFTDMSGAIQDMSETVGNLCDALSVDAYDEPHYPAEAAGTGPRTTQDFMELTEAMNKQKSGWTGTEETVVVHSSASEAETPKVGEEINTEGDQQ